MTSRIYWEHLARVTVEEHIGRFLKPEEIVHHKDGDITNYEISNLDWSISRGEHTSHHNLGNKYNLGHHDYRGTQKMKNELSERMKGNKLAKGHIHHHTQDATERISKANRHPKSEETKEKMKKAWEERRKRKCSII